MYFQIVLLCLNYLKSRKLKTYKDLMSSKRVLSQHKLFSTASYINNVIEEERPGEKKEVQAGNICKKETYKSQKTQLCE